MGHPVRRDQPLSCRVWVEAAILDNSVGKDRAEVEKQFTLELLRYLAEGHYFEDVQLLPGAVGKEDVLFTLNMGQFRYRYLPVPPSWFFWKLPPGTDEIEFWGKLLVRNNRGRELARGVAHIKGRDRSTSSSKVQERFTDLLTKMLQDLLEQILPYVLTSQECGRG